jgi:hypothetical protein
MRYSKAMNALPFSSSTPRKAHQGFSKGVARDDCSFPRIKQGSSRVARVFLLIRAREKENMGKKGFSFTPIYKIVRKTLATLDKPITAPQKCKTTLAGPLLQPLLER